MSLLERFFSAAKRVKLQNAERASIRSILAHSVREGAQDGLLDMMDAPPAPFVAAARSVHAHGEDIARVRATLASYTTSYVPSHQRRFLLLKRSFAAFAATLVFGSTVCAAAESAVPGDVLYPVKTAVNEPILEAWASLTPADRARWKVTQVNRRLKEMATLSDRKALTPDREEKLLQKIDERTQQALEHIDALETAGQAGSSAEIRALLGKALRKNEKLLQKLEQRNPRLRPRVRQFLRRTEGGEKKQPNLSKPLRLQQELLKRGTSSGTTLKPPFLQKLREKLGKKLLKQRD